MSNRTADNYVDYQERATEFAPGDIVVPFGQFTDSSGRVTAVWPAIGMVDVEFSAGNKRYPVEDLQRVDLDSVGVIPPMTNSAPGGQPTVSVPGGPYPQVAPHQSLVPTTIASTHAQRVAEAFVKKALYWNAPDRQYKATNEEVSSGHFLCPKCKAQGTISKLRPAIYKRRDAKSEKLLGCPECLFLVKKQDIIGVDEPEGVV